MVNFVCNGTVKTICAGSLSTLEQTQSSFDTKTPRVALQSVETLLQEV